MDGASKPSVGTCGHYQVVKNKVSSCFIIFQFSMNTVPTRGTARTFSQVALECRLQPQDPNFHWRQQELRAKDDQTWPQKASFGQRYPLVNQHRNGTKWRFSRVFGTYSTSRFPCASWLPLGAKATVSDTRPAEPATMMPRISGYCCRCNWLKSEISSNIKLCVGKLRTHHMASLSVQLAEERNPPAPKVLGRDLPDGTRKRLQVYLGGGHFSLKTACF